MVEIFVYKTSEEAEEAIKQWREANLNSFKELEQSEGPSLLLRSQRYVFIAELAAYSDENPDRYYYNADYPFQGETDCYDDIASLAQGVKDAVRRQTPRNLELVLYTIDNHDAENERNKREIEACSRFARMTLYEDYAENPSEAVPPKKIEEYLRYFNEVGNSSIRALTEQERQEFVRLYEENSA
ncbi:MAG TPA: hypothetical protein VJC21_02465 [Candidatus Nanoarchaeia archaeon]|nr:hypothetical protein [Candidatus Nanoarchaeia archaeon]